MRKIYILTLMLMMCVMINADIIENAFTPGLLTPSFLNTNNITINHSVSFMSGISSNKQSYYQSVYTNHLNYQFSPKLNLKLDLNFVNFGTATYKSGIEFEGNNDNTSKILPSFQLNYAPSENTSFTIEFKQYTAPRIYDRFWR